jgi:hypothetical protein
VRDDAVVDSVRAVPIIPPGSASGRRRARLFASEIHWKQISTTCTLGACSQAGAQVQGTTMQSFPLSHLYSAKLMIPKLGWKRSARADLRPARRQRFRRPAPLHSNSGVFAVVQSVAPHHIYRLESLPTASVTNIFE